MKKITDFLELLQKIEKDHVLSGSKRLFAKGKIDVLNFFILNGRWPKRTSVDLKEKILGGKLGNYCSPTSGSYDKQFHKLVTGHGRTTVKRRKWAKGEIKKEILSFMETHNRAPIINSKNEFEHRLANNVNRYVFIKKDMKLLGKIYQYDKCFRTGIRSKYRPMINTAGLKKPLIKIAK